MIEYRQGISLCFAQANKFWFDCLLFKNDCGKIPHMLHVINRVKGVHHVKIA